MTFGPYKGWDVEDIQKKVPKWKIEDWLEFYRRCPWGPKVEAKRHAQILRYLHAIQANESVDLKEFSQDRTEEFRDQYLIELGLETKRDQFIRRELSEGARSFSDFSKDVGKTRTSR